MNNYIPFLKFKTNEIGALSTLTPQVQAKSYPFLDFPKKEGMSEEKFIEMIAKAETSFKRHLKNFPAIFLDNFDIDDSIKVAGRENYSLIIDTFGKFAKFIPVVGLDRPKARNDLVFQAKSNGLISGSAIAIRLLADDFQSFSIVEKELLELQRQGDGLFDQWIIVLDNRLCTTLNAAACSVQINKFIAAAIGKVKLNAVIVAGSSIPASIGEVLNVLKEIHHPRREIEIYRNVFSKKHAVPVFLGDYTIVSPLYSDLTIPAEAMQNVIAAKIIYSYGDFHYIVRGGSLKSHARKRLQYNDISARIVNETFYRGAAYSEGDLYLTQKAQFMGKGITPGSILKPTINAHITFMFTDFPG